MKLSDMEEASRLARHYEHQRETYKKLRDAKIEFSIAFDNKKHTPTFIGKLKADLLRYMLEELDEMQVKLKAYGIEVD